MTSQAPSKPLFGSPCNGCGYCCTAQPCQLAQQFLNCQTGPCVALEWEQGRSRCGLSRNPLAYIFKAANPDADVPLLDDPPDIQASAELSRTVIEALGIGKGCDADDDATSARWPAPAPA